MGDPERREGRVRADRLAALPALLSLLVPVLVATRSAGAPVPERPLAESARAGPSFARSSGNPVTSDPVREANLLRLPVRVHLLSARLDRLRSTYTEEEVRRFVRRASEIWDQAEVAWSLESVVREEVDRGAERELERLLSRGSPITVDLLADLLPRGRLLEGGWDVFVMRSMPGAPGLYVRHLPAVVASELDPSGEGDPGRILAHELGHSLSLEHVRCTRGGNLMAPGCASVDRTRLTARQIARARRQAERGVPAR